MHPKAIFMSEQAQGLKQIGTQILSGQPCGQGKSLLREGHAV